MPMYETPGVYYERVDANAATISPMRTDIAGFVGIARRGPVNVPVPIESWRQFQAYFGNFTGAGYLTYAVHGFFENNGRRCRVVRVASARVATAQVIFRSPPPSATSRIADMAADLTIASVLLESIKLITKL